MNTMMIITRTPSVMPYSFSETVKFNRWRAIDIVMHFFHARLMREFNKV